jgi:1-acyl-sn-glycerol-3-phosphate acyltransferase
MHTEVIKKDKSDIKKVKFNYFLYYILNPIFNLITKIFFRKKTFKNNIKGLKGPFLVLSTHTSNADFAFINFILWPKKINLVTAEKLKYEAKLTRNITKKFHTIEKKQFTVDIRCIRNIINYLNNNISVLIFPEGKISSAGRGNYISPTITKLIKLCNVPVISCNIKGGYLGMPRWAHNIRRSIVRVDLDLMFNQDDISKLSNEEMYKIIVDRLKISDYDYQFDNKIIIKHKNLAERLEKVIYKCPCCGEEFKMVSYFDIIRCSACDNTLRYTEKGKLEPLRETDKAVYDRVDDWFEYQRDAAKKEIMDENFKIEIDTKLVPLDLTKTFNQLNLDLKNKIPEDADRGVLTLTKEGLTYEGTKFKNPVIINYPSKMYPTYGYISGEKLEFFDNEYVYCYYTRKATKLFLLQEESYKKHIGIEYNEIKQLTKQN